MTNRENVKKAVHFGCPVRIPLIYVNKDLERSDVYFISYKEITDSNDILTSEWGFVWERIDDTMGQPKHAAIHDWTQFEKYKIPDPHITDRYSDFPVKLSNAGDRYRIAGLGISGFNRVAFIRGFEHTLEDFYLEPENLMKLINIVFDFECEVIKEMCQYDIDAIGFGDDWGSQESLLISPSMWRDIFKLLYKKQFDIIHSYGKDVFFHCCGNIADIIPDLVELGADVLNLNQPDVLGLDWLSQFTGKVCFNCPVDHQTVAIKGTPSEIEEYIHRMIKALNTPKGGFIGNIEEYSSVGMPPENYEAIKNIFESIRNDE